MNNPPLNPGLRHNRLNLSREDFEWVKEMLTKLKEAKILSVTFQFAGCGDEGSVEEGVIAFEEEKESICYKMPEWLKDFVLDEENKIENIINGPDIDWWNDDGGCGKLIINVERRYVELEIGTYSQELTPETPMIAKF